MIDRTSVMKLATSEGVWHFNTQSYGQEGSVVDAWLEASVLVYYANVAM